MLVLIYFKNNEYTITVHKNKVANENQLEGLGEWWKLPSGVWDKAKAASASWCTLRSEILPGGNFSLQTP